MPAMLQMYHAGLARLQSQQYNAPYPGQALSALWPTHSHLTHGVQSLIQSPSLHLPASQPSTKTFFRPTEDSCGGSSGSTSSDTNGSDTNSGDEVDVEIIETKKSASNLSFSITNLLGTKSSSKKNSISIGSPSSSSDQESSIGTYHQMGGLHFAHQLQPQLAPFRPFKTEAPCGPAEHKCEICGKCFKHIRMLNRHRRNHSPYKKYKCTYCNKGFNDSFDLKRHVRTHTGVKPYKCDFCEKSFTQRCSLESHQDKIHGVKCTMPYKKRREKIYVCEECGYSTGDVREHYKHAREAHSCTHSCTSHEHPTQVKEESQHGCC